MKKSIRGPVFAAALVVSAVFLSAETMIVKTQNAGLRQEPKFYSPVTSALKTGDVLEKLADQDGWVKVKTAGGLVGWIHSSAVETKKFNLLAVDKSLKTEATASEVALAGKGFNKQVEDSYKTKHGEANFAAVDKMLRINVPPSDIAAFLKDGKLGEFGGSK